ncbi:MAG: class I SAM-dependent methyltransferase [Candidatus Nitrosotenuis sp.]
MRIEEYISSLPHSIISGDDVQLLDDSLRDIFRFAGLGRNDVFYHLGCGTGNSLVIAEKEFGARSVGIDIDVKKIEKAKKTMHGLEKSQVRCEDILESDISDATVILFWFSDTTVTEIMMEKFSKLDKARIITIFDPLPWVLPSKVNFPYILHRTPLKTAKTLKDQIRAVFDTECIDFTTAWEHAERYTKAIGSPDAGNDRFLTILQTVTIWINAKKLGLSCTEEMPDPIKAYVEILHNFFNIEVKHLLE